LLTSRKGIKRIGEILTDRESLLAKSTKRSGRHLTKILVTTDEIIDDILYRL